MRKRVFVNLKNNSKTHDEMLLHSVFGGGSFFFSFSTNNNYFFSLSPLLLCVHSFGACFELFHNNTSACAVCTLVVAIHTHTSRLPVRVVVALHALLAGLLRLARTASYIVRKRNRRYTRISWLLFRFEQIACTPIGRMFGQKCHFHLISGEVRAEQ